MPSSLGKALGEILKKLYGHVVPDLYPKLEMGSRPLKGTRPRTSSKPPTSRRCPPVFYAGEQGLGLVVKDGAKFVPNPAADVAKEVLDYLMGEHGYGNKETRTGKALEKKFGGIGYGWDRDMLRLILAVLFRAGSIEVTHGGEKFDNYQDPRCRTPFVNNTAFKSALFTPVKPIDLPDLEPGRRELRGPDRRNGGRGQERHRRRPEEVRRRGDEEGPAHRGPGQGPSVAGAGHRPGVQESLTSIEAGSPDDCVNTLAGGGASLKQPTTAFARSPNAWTTRASCSSATPGERRARCGPSLKPSGDGPPATGREAQGTFVCRGVLRIAILHPGGDPGDPGGLPHACTRPHADRAEQFQAAIEKIKGRAEWSAVPESMRQPVLQPLQSRCCTEPHLPDGSLVCKNCGATLSQMESDLAALGGLFAQVVAQIQKLTTPPETKLKRVRVAEFFAGSMETEDQVKQAVARLQDHLLKLLAEGVKIVVE